ncbi:TrlF family AAA-like ATPase [Arthrobacter sp. ISL-5]|uniref:TrlF family AAA-like ATPase n=1 Tax=Arthrobacter sp. ISL-5 TaxID=2819111 RepID=UPI001BE721A9|nr:hypothetical protein [Arthrobacter sp. ISL-5]MBT2555823.1 hypothetical protein [Arthrobacter sp. ISL-5]
MKVFARGSEWRKWDLHVHAPGGTMEDRYVDGSLDEIGILDRFCKTLAESDVEVIGLTDYFSLDNYFRVTERYQEIYGKTDKVFFPNLELRLVESVSKKLANVNLHLIFDPSLPKTQLSRFISQLKTTHLGTNRTAVTCSELGPQEYDSASVYLEEVRKTLEDVFGADESWRGLVFPVMPAGNDGIRPEGKLSGSRRKKVLAGNLDLFTSGIFGNPNDVAYYQNEVEGSTRKEDLPPRPVYAGCDAHSFEDLESWLGREARGSAHKHVTWIKADPTFEGLLQTAIEASERVRLQATKPDRKQPYQVITAVNFPHSADFPATITLNQNLVSVIGSRSSGKSSLLAHVAHAVDAKYTKQQQLDSGFYTSLEETGPAAGRTWKNTPADICQVIWGDSPDTAGKVIYIPQNSLFNLNERSSEITGKIEPILFRARPDFEAAHAKVLVDIKTSGEDVQKSLKDWFAQSSQIREMAAKVNEIGDPDAIRKQKAELTSQLERHRAETLLLDDEVSRYQAVMEQLARLEGEKASRAADLAALSPYLVTDGVEAQETLHARVTVSITASPSPEVLPTALHEAVAKMTSEASTSLSKAIAEVLIEHQKQLLAEAACLDSSVDELRAANIELIEKNEANSVIDELVQQIGQQDQALTLIEKLESDLNSMIDSRDESLSSLSLSLDDRARTISDHLRFFHAGLVEVDGMKFGIEGELDPGKLSALAQDFDQRSNTEFVERNVGLRIEQVLAKPADFLNALVQGDQKLKQGKSVTSVAEQVFTLVPDFHFFAELEGDRIGGFERSSMTPGKQAMFALQLILSESDDRWPLLIDQPEDDLDSRSIYEHVVPYLKKRKTERQVIMVTHNANLVVGADSEQVIVANRHGTDSRNAGDRTFDYLTGSLEHTMTLSERPHKLESCGIREHACEILDGGREAFQKRKDKYRV